MEKYETSNPIYQMKTFYCSLLAFCFTLTACRESRQTTSETAKQENPVLKAEKPLSELPKLESISELAKRENPVLKLPTPDPDEILRQLEKLHCGLSTYKAIHQLVKYAREYTPPGDEKKNGTSPTYRLCLDGMSVHVFYQMDQRVHAGVGYLEKELKGVAESIMLYALKKMEWVALRSPVIEDDYFKSYYFTLQRYLEIFEGKIIVDGQWKQVAVGVDNRTF